MSSVTSNPVPMMTYGQREEAKNKTENKPKASAVITAPTPTATATAQAAKTSRDLVHIAAAEHTQRALVQVHNGQVLPPHGVDRLVALDADQQERAQLARLLQHCDVALGQRELDDSFCNEKSVLLREGLCLVEHVPCAVHVAAGGGVTSLLKMAGKQGEYTTTSFSEGVLLLLNCLRMRNKKSNEDGKAAA